MGITGGGAYARYVVVHEREAIAVPQGMDVAQAGGVPEAYLTAFDALVAQMGLQAGESVLIHAVGSGVGTARPVGRRRDLRNLADARQAQAGSGSRAGARRPGWGGGME